MKSPLVRSFLIAGAFSTWCFLDCWAQLAKGNAAHFARYDPVYTIAIPVLCCEALLTLAIVGIWRWVRIEESKLLQFGFLAASLFPIGIAAVALLSISPIDLAPIVRRPLFWPAALALGILPFAFAILRPKRASQAMLGVFLYSWPVLLVMYFQAGRFTLRYSRADYADGALAPRLTSTPRVRVVWIIFDELSEAVAFDRRPAGLALPNFDRMKSQSFWAASAQAPAGFTEQSMPALIVGREVVESAPRGLHDVALQSTPGGEPFSWTGSKNVFDDARALGLNTALVGWSHPYGRILNRSLTECDWAAGWLLPGAEETLEPQPLLEAMWYRIRLQVAALPLLGHVPGVFPGRYDVDEKRRRFVYLLDRARKVAADPGIGLALIHLQAPHPPAIYKRATAMYSSEKSLNYFDNLALADRALGEIRDAIDSRGLGDRTVVLVTGDHGWRTNLWRGSPVWTSEEDASPASHGDTSGVPFLLHFPAAPESVEYAEPLNTVITRPLIVSLLKGSIRSAKEAGAWLNDRAATRDRPD